MITNPTPQLRRPFVEANMLNCHLHIGKFAKLTSSGELSLIASGSETPSGVIIAADSPLHAWAGGKPSGTILLHTFGGIVEVQLAADHGQILPGSKLVVVAGGAVRLAAASEKAVAIAVEGIATVQAGQLIRAVMVTPGTVTA